VENFAKKISEQREFEPEVFLLSSGEYVTAARVVQKREAARSWSEPGVQSGKRRSAEVNVHQRGERRIFFGHAASEPAHSLALINAKHDTRVEQGKKFSRQPEMIFLTTTRSKTKTLTTEDTEEHGGMEHI